MGGCVSIQEEPAIGDRRQPPARGSSSISSSSRTTTPLPSQKIQGSSTPPVKEVSSKKQSGGVANGSSPGPSTPKASPLHRPPSTFNAETTLLRKFSYEELARATGQFRTESMLGEGGFGGVFKGIIGQKGGDGTGGRAEGGETVAVKLLNLGGQQGEQEWLAEVIFLGKLSHPNLVRLVGFCAEGRNRLLVYEFLSQGSFERHLFSRSRAPVSWDIRMKVALDAAKGLAYLHEEAEQQVIYRDFKASNILVDQKFNAKLSDFGLAKDGPQGNETHVSTRVMGTYGYAAPEYVMTGHLTAKSDVFSYGVVLLEMITGRRAMERSLPPKDQYIVEWCRPYFSSRQELIKMVDPRLKGEFSVRGALKAAVLAQSCLNKEPKARPLMSDVVNSLNYLQNLTDRPTLEQLG